MKYSNGKNRDAFGEEIKPQAVAAVRRFQRRAKEAETRAEKAFFWVAHGLWRLCGIRYVKQVIFYLTVGVSFRADFVFRKHRLIVEIDGSSHAGREERDAWRDTLLFEKYGYRTIRFKNEEVLNSPRRCRIRLIQALIDSPKGRKRGLSAYLTAQQSMNCP